MENLKATLEDIVEELEVGLQESLEGNLESEVSDVNETFKSTVDLPMHLQKEFTSSIIDFPNKNSSDALSSRGAYNYIPPPIRNK